MKSAEIKVGEFYLVRFTKGCPGILARTVEEPARGKVVVERRIWKLADEPTAGGFSMKGLAGHGVAPEDMDKIPPRHYAPGLLPVTVSTRNVLRHSELTFEDLG